MIGNRIKSARKFRKHSQAWLAEEIGVTQPSVQHWEAGKSEPTTNNLSLVAQVLSVRFEWLATGSGEMLPSPSSELENLHTWHSPEEIELLELLKQLPKGKRQSLLMFLKTWLN